MSNTSITITPQFPSNLVTTINCGTSSPRLGGTIDLSSFPNLQEFRCNSNDITAITGYTNNSNLRVLAFFQNKVTGSLPSLNALTNLREFSCNVNQISGSIPSLSGLNNLQFFNAQSNAFTGSIPILSGLVNLRDISILTNQLTGSIPSLSGLIELRTFRCSNQTGTTKLTGSIPSFDGLINISNFECNTNQLTGFDGGSISNTLGFFQAQNNLLTSTAINDILAAFVVANRTTGTRILNLGGTGNAAPTGQGLTDKATLISRGWTVTTN